MGSKKWLRREVEALIPADTELLISPFFGSGQIEYHVAKTRPQITVQGSDLFRPVVNFHKQLPVEGIREYVGEKMERETYKHMVCRIGDVDDHTSAIWAYVILHNSFNGKFGSFVKRAPITETGVARLEQLACPNVSVCQRDCFEVLNSLPADCKLCLYLDPPYVIKHKYDKYYRGERQGDLVEFHRKLAETIKQADVPFVLSIHDSSEVRELYSGYHIQEMHVEYKTKSATKSELLIHNLGKKKSVTP
jgi:site-specific DNA-adenine methylase